MKKMILLIVLNINVISLYSQVLHQNAYWLRLYFRVKINDNWSAQTEFDNRRFFGENQQLQFITHTHLHRKIGKNTSRRDMEGSLGFTFSEVWQGDLPVPELRPFQEFYTFNKLSNKWRLSHRFRTEQRWFHNYIGEKLTSGFNFKFRFRYMSRLEYRFSDKVLMKGNAEVMYHHDDFDQYRYYGGLEYKFFKNLSIEAGYLKVYQKRANNKGYFDRDNLRVTIYKDFVLK